MSVDLMLIYNIRSCYIFRSAQIQTNLDYPRIAVNWWIVILLVNLLLKVRGMGFEPMNP